jgi:triacylglycerol lipase
VQKINLIGHSFGGNTIRLLASLMEYGSKAEEEASPDGYSPLFEGGNGNFINSITTLCSPHNGSTLYYVVDRQKLIPTALAVLQTAGGITDVIDGGMIDFQLEHFGIFSGSADAMTMINDSFINGNDNAFYDLSPHGAKELNETIKTVEDVYYFSFAYCTTEKAPLTGKQTPTLSTMLVLMPFARLIGTYTNTSDDAPVMIDESWLPNDGLVNVVSAQKPNGEDAVNYTASAEIERGKWYVFPTLTGDHGTVIGMHGNAQQTRKFYTDQIALIDSLPRIK